MDTVGYFWIPCKHELNLQCVLCICIVAYGSDLLNFTGAGEGVDVRHSKLPQFYFVEAKEIEEVKGTVHHIQSLLPSSSFLPLLSLS